MEDVMGLFQSIDPDGETPTADIFDDGLGDYSQDEYVKGLDSSCSLMVTLHLGKMSRVKKLAEMDARELQVGVQFVQIGDDGKATQFLKELDNNIQEEYGLDRGMVDTVSWIDDHTDEDRLVEKILLGGILKRIDDSEEASVERTAS